MAEPANDCGTSDRVAALRAASGVDLEEITSIVQSIVNSLEGDLSVKDLQLFRELEAMANEIRMARREIINLSEINDDHIARATDELDAVVSATEDATNNIMEAAEIIESIAGDMKDNNGDRLVDAVTAIYEACSFQDITGQRVGKVVNTLRFIETRITNIVSAMGDQIAEHDQSAPNEARKGEAGKSDERDLLNGPQLGSEGRSKAEIDALLADMD